MNHVAHANESCCTCECVMMHMQMSHAAHVNESCDICDRDSEKLHSAYQ